MFRLSLLMKEVTYRPVPLERRVRRDTATEHRKPNGAKLPHEKTGSVERETKRNQEKRETPKPPAHKKERGSTTRTAHNKTRMGNANSPTTKREKSELKHASEPTAKTVTGEPEKRRKFRIAPNVKLRGAALLRRPS